MKLIGNGINGRFLREVLPAEEHDVDWVKAAIAYGNDTRTLIDSCLENKLRLDIWMRYDETVPVGPRLLRYLLNNIKRNLFCYLIPDAHHAKIIWWKGYGVYIGSANLTDRAWNSNIEAGVFFDDSDLEDTGMGSEVEAFFDRLESLPVAKALTEEIVAEQEALNETRRKPLEQIDRRSREHRSIDYWGGTISGPDQRSASEKKRRNNIDEWKESMSIIYSLADRVIDSRPEWIAESVPALWQTDQFLHAYYFKYIADGRSHPFREKHQANKSRPDLEVGAALEWWASQTSAPTNEQNNLYDKAPAIRTRLARDRIDSLTESDFIILVQSTHASIEHAKKIPATKLGVTSGKSLDNLERQSLFGSYLWALRNREGGSVVDVLNHVLYGGPWQEVPERLFDVVGARERRIPNFGINQIAEMVGWAMPEHYAPRNGRTSKALYALGYNVAIR